MSNEVKNIYHWLITKSKQTNTRLLCDKFLKVNWTVHSKEQKETKN